VHNRSFRESLSFAWAGLRWAWQTQKNIRRHALAAVAALILAHVLAFTAEELVLVILTIALVVTVELINTALETAIDLCQPHYHPLAKQAKDVAAAAVLVTALVALIVALFLFGPRLLGVFRADSLSRLLSCGILKGRS